MDRIIIIDDNGIRDDLNHFIESNKNHIRLDSDFFELSSGRNSIIKEIIESYESQHKIKIHSKDQIYILRVNELLYIEEVYKNVKLILTKGDPILIEGDIQTFEKQIKTQSFISTHPNFLININHIRSISEDSNFVILSNKARIPISEYKKNIIISKLEKYFK
jgi:DNA-binding LytR/AlgR family response regulator